jgi:hypothetical protein
MIDARPTEARPTDARVDALSAAVPEGDWT